jgi:hypothetical protein
MRGRILATLPGILLLAALLVAHATAQGPVTGVGRHQPSLDGQTLAAFPRPRAAQSPSGPTDIGFSTVNSVEPIEVPIGMDFDLCFNVTVDSPDLEYMDRFDVDLPDNWTVVGVHHVPDNGCGWGTIEGQEASNVVYWQVDNVLPSSCGAWKNGSYDFCARVSLPDCSGAPWGLPWNIMGDGDFAPPHEASGITPELICRAPGLYLSPKSIYSGGCPGVEENYTLNLFNYTFADGTFSLTYDVTSHNATVRGPDSVYLGHGVDQDLLVVVTPDTCLPTGEHVIVSVKAQGNTYDDVTTLDHLISTPGCPPCQILYLPLTFRNY